MDSLPFFELAREIETFFLLSTIVVNTGATLSL